MRNGKVKTKYLDDIPTRRLLITPFSERHLTDRYVGWLNDKELMRYSEQRHRVHTFDSCRAYWKSFKSTPHYFWAIETLGSDATHIGNINGYISETNSIADIGILVGGTSENSYRNIGYGVEAWVAVCDFVFSKLKIRKISAGTMSINTPMLRLMSRVGMVPDGERARHYLCGGNEVDIVYAAFFREKWPEHIRQLRDSGIVDLLTNVNG